MRDRLFIVVQTSFLIFVVFGNYYRWGRGNDGHEKYNSATSSTQMAWDVRIMVNSLQLLVQLG